jgi:hypothetical protein
VKRSLIVLLLVSRPLFAGFAGRDLVLPVVGRAVSATGQLFVTTVWITNIARRPAAVTLSFLEAGHANLSPRKFRIALAPGATHVFDPLNVSSIGALRIESSVPIFATARISTGDAGTSFAAIPTRLAIGNAQSSILQGFTASSGRYKIYVVETTGEPLAFRVTIVDAKGNVRAEKHLYINRYEHRPYDITEMFPGIDGTTVGIEGTNGSGRIIAMGLHTPPGTHDGNAFEMSFLRGPRTALTWIEAATYISVALAVITAAFIRR